MNRCLALGSLSEMLLRNFESRDFLPAMGVQIKKPWSMLLLDTNEKKKMKKKWGGKWCSSFLFYTQGH